mmetsp:Transcript_132096/g.240361  ORF Transcript_132096/g.240361 Transcript_132096/m.240361 type:complete len:163 (+) Transcript_132096:32-520(+)
MCPPVALSDVEDICRLTSCPTYCPQLQTEKCPLRSVKGDMHVKNTFLGLRSEEDTGNRKPRSASVPPDFKLSEVRETPSIVHNGGNRGGCECNVSKSVQAVRSCAHDCMTECSKATTVPSKGTLSSQEEVATLELFRILRSKGNLRRQRQKLRKKVSIEIDE